MAKPKTHVRMNITMPINMAKMLRSNNGHYGSISHQIVAAVEKDFQRKLVCRNQGWKR